VSKPQILIIDEMRVSLSYVAQFLTERGYVVNTSESEGQLLGKLAGGAAPSVILLDIVLPGANGLEILAPPSDNLSFRPRLLCCLGVGHAKSVVEAMRMGASDYLTNHLKNKSSNWRSRTCCRRRACRKR